MVAGEGPGEAVLEQGAVQALPQLVCSLLASYGWFLLFGCVALYLLLQKMGAPRRIRPSGTAPPLEPDVVVRQQEALAAARIRMQEELNAQAEKYKEKQRQLEEEKRRQKIAMWESMQEGKSYKEKRNQQEVESDASVSSTIPKSKPNKRPLRGAGYNPLSGEGGGTCSWRPGRRGGPSSGG